MAKKAASKTSRKTRGFTHFQLDLKTFVPYRVSILATLIRRALSDVYRDDPGLTEPEWRVLTTLAHIGPLPSGDIGLHMTLDRMAISRALTRLIDLGLVERAHYDRDQRMSEVNLTLHGSQTFDRLARHAAAISDWILETLAEGEITELLRLIDKVEMRFRSQAGPRRAPLIETVQAVPKRRPPVRTPKQSRRAAPAKARRATRKRPPAV